MTNTDYEYVVVGSGAGGGPLAANLAMAGYRVLVLEAGTDEGETPNYQVPAFACAASEDPDMAWNYFVRHYGSDERQRRDPKFVPERDGVFYPRAGTLGGCTAHNAMITISPQNGDWDAIAALTEDDSWRADNMRMMFERLEQCRYRPVSKLVNLLFRWNPGRRGFSGWLPTSLANPLAVARDGELLQALRESVRTVVRTLGDPIGRIRRAIIGMMDPNDWTLVKDDAEGVRLTPLAIKDGRRFGTRDYLRQAEKDARGSLTIVTNALATRVILDASNRATGVEYLQGRHLYRADPAAPAAGNATPTARTVVNASREVIVSAGAFNTPQLLMLSGIGPREELERVGIPVRVELPGVGRNLQDRYEVAVVIRMKDDFKLLKGATFRSPGADELPDPYYRDWLEGKGPYAANGAVFAVLKRSSKARRDPDLFVFAGVGDFRGYRPGYSQDLFRTNNHFTWCVLKAHTLNQGGRVTLRSADPCDTPLIDFHYFDEGTDAAGDDLEAVCDGVDFARTLASDLGDLAAEECPGPAVKTREQLREWVKNEAWGHHASCSCRIGADGDPLAVLDSKFRVRGTKGLRVVDASVFPRIPGYFIVTSVYMISEKATISILEDARRTAVPQ